MSAARIGLMGFGRIGRNVFRMLADNPNLEVAAIADIADPAGLTYLLKYDSIYGRFPKPVELEGDSLFLDGRRIPFIDAPMPAPTKAVSLAGRARRGRRRPWRPSF